MGRPPHSCPDATALGIWRRYPAAVGSEKRINLGCGTTAPEGWVNIDRSPGLILSKAPGLRWAASKIVLLRGPQAHVEWPEGIRRLDVTKGLPFRTSSADAIYSSHMLEHLARRDAIRLLGECRRVLRPGGVLRLALPDLRRMASIYVQSRDPEAADAFVEASGLGIESFPRGSRRLIKAVSGARHRWMYDAASIASLCQKAGSQASRNATTGRERARTWRTSSIVRIASSSKRRLLAEPGGSRRAVGVLGVESWLRS